MCYNAEYQQEIHRCGSFFCLSLSTPSTEESDPTSATKDSWSLSRIETTESMNMRFGSYRYSSPIEGSVGGSTDGGFESSTNPLMLLVDLTPGPDPQLEKKLQLDLEMCRPGCRRLGWREREAG